MKRNIAIVVPDLILGHGVSTAAAFLVRVIEDSHCYSPHLISLASSASDTSSVRMQSPQTWLRGCQVSRGIWRGQEYEHVGAMFSELEFQRYMPRRRLTELVEPFDLVQVVAGTPAWAYSLSGARPPVALHAATLISAERMARLSKEVGLRRIWLGLMTTVNARLELAALRNIDVAFVMNERMLERLPMVAPKLRVRFAPPGIDTDFFSPGVYQDTGYILSVGRFSDPRKNVRMLFTSYARICSTLPNAPDLVLVGKAPSPQDMRYATNLGVAHRVRIFSDVSQTDLIEFYRGASLFVLSSDEEGFGLVILEAMACALPVVCTDCGGPATLVTNGVTGFRVPVGDTAALAAACEGVLTTPNLARQLGEGGRQRAVDVFSLPITAKVFLDEYDRLLSS